jgi:phage-related protein
MRVEEDILALPPCLLARYLHLVDLLIEFGPMLGMPHVRSMGEKLFELRIKSAEGIARAMFCARLGRRIVVLHVFVKKSEKTPRHELETARRRLKEVVRDDA